MIGAVVRNLKVTSASAKESWVDVLIAFERIGEVLTEEVLRCEGLNGNIVRLQVNTGPMAARLGSSNNVGHGGGDKLVW